MAIEIEKKYRLDKKRLVELTAKLGELGADFLYETFEENYLHRGGLLDARTAFLRLRKTNAVNTLTYKERVVSETDFKHQIEFETIVSDVDATEHRRPTEARGRQDYRLTARGRKILQQEIARLKQLTRLAGLRVIATEQQT